MATLAVSSQLLSDYAKLEKQVQRKLSEIASTFQRCTAQQLRDHSGLHLERYSGQADPRARTIRITDNHRGIVCDTGDGETFVLHEVLTHDDADRWMTRNSFRVNPATGALEIRDIEAIEAKVAAAPPAAPEPGPLFAHRKDKEFTQLGIDEDLLPALRAFTDQDQLQGLLAVLPESQVDTLILLTGSESPEEIYAEVAGATDPAQIREDDLAGALTAPASEAMFQVVDGEAELGDMLAQPLARWRTFLHHSQRDLAQRGFNGPARVIGGPGTGKTVVAMHRAKALADRLDDRSGKPILFTTFTRNLAQSIERELRSLGGADLLDVVDVINVDSLAHRLIRDHESARPGVITDHDLDELWDAIAGELSGEWTGEFLANEWEQVILAQKCRSRADYFRVGRAGRGIPLDRRSRAEVWKAVEAMGQRLVGRGQRTFLQMADAAAGYLDGQAVRPYRHVIVDESQDLHEAQWRMLREVVAEGPDDLFIVGDSHQRIYDRRTSLSKVGINIRGRSKRLRINYRTTHEILHWALALLGEETYDDLDEAADSSALADYHSFLHGPRPEAVGARSQQAELSGLTETVTGWIDGGLAEEDIVVTSRTKGPLDAVERALADAGIATCQLGPT